MICGGIPELSFGIGSLHNGHARAGILAGSAVAARIGGSLLAVCNTHHMRMRAQGVEVGTYDTVS